MGRHELTISYKTFGCRVNQADTNSIMRRFWNRGFTVVPFGNPVDVIVVNTCTVTHVADRKARQSINRVLRTHPDAVVAITGCYATVQQAEVRSLFPGARVFPINAHDKMVDDICSVMGLEADDVATNCRPQSLRFSRIRPIIKVQEGCDHVCAFCIVPRARGKSVSRGVAGIVSDVKSLVADGAAEIVLSGVSLGRYVCPDTGCRIGGLATQILGDTDVPRLRLSSLEPMDFDRSLVDLLSNQRLCPHLHLPLQSGSNTILAKMRRPYTVDEYRDLTESVRAVSPDISITTDVMVGFPGETDTDFAETVTFINEIEFAALHVFPYSRRLRTLAAHSEQTVDATVKRARVSALIDLAAIGSLQYASRFDDTVRQIVWERAIDGLLVGLTDNYLRVTSRAATDLAGKLGLARLQIRSDGDIMAVPTGRAESGAT